MSSSLQNLQFDDFKDVPGVSIHEPWASLIVAGYKDVENRKTRISHRGPLLIHASKTGERCGPEQLAEISARHGVNIELIDLQFGGIIGVANVVDCVRGHPSPWSLPNQWQWVLAEARQLAFRPCRGRQGLFYPGRENTQSSTIHRR